MKWLWALHHKVWLAREVGTKDDDSVPDVELCRWSWSGSGWMYKHANKRTYRWECVWFHGGCSKDQLSCQNPNSTQQSWCAVSKIGHMTSFNCSSETCSSRWRGALLCERPNCASSVCVCVCVCVCICQSTVGKGGTASLLHYSIITRAVHIFKVAEGMHSNTNVCCYGMWDITYCIILNFSELGQIANLSSG